MALVLNVVGSGIAAILFAAIGLSVCWAPIVPLSDALALQHLGTGRRQAYGQIRLWMSIGFSLAALAFGGLYTWVGLEGMPTTFGIALLAFALWTLIADLPSSSALRDRNDSKIWALGALFRSAPRLFVVLLASLLVAIGVNATLTFVPLRIGGLGGGPVWVGLAMALAAAVEVPVMAFSARLVKRIGLKGCFVLAALQYAIAFLAISVLSSPAAITVVFATDGIGFALLYVSMVIAVDTLVPPSFRATGQGLRQTVALGLAPILGAAGGGLLYSSVGPSALFLAASTMAAAGGLIGWSALSAPILSRDAVAPDRLETAGHRAEGE
jgi:PPP family 3-phenylpropionic acid transporter